jgi:aryl-alcohol dehydrogenase-like predicted oxidoreductase
MTTTTLSANAAASGTFNLGNDLPIHRLGFGAMRITGKGIWGEPENPEEARRVLQRAVELGVNFIDTADSYGPEVSERLIAEALHPYPAGLVIATKGGLTRQGPEQWAPVGRPEYIQQCVEMSLRRLKLERIDLYQLHRIDPKVPAEETLGALEELQRAGKIHHIGLSEVSTKEIKRAKKIVSIVSAEPVQPSRSRTRRGAQLLRKAQSRIHPLVSGSSRRPRSTGGSAGSRGPETQRDGRAALAGLAPPSITCCSTDSRNFLGGSSGRKCGRGRSETFPGGMGRGREGSGQVGVVGMRSCASALTVFYNHR